MGKPPDDIYKDADPQVLKIVQAILNLEKEYLFVTRPKGIAEEIINILKKEIKE
jgi:hypothetical protein|tara:strand:- start:284 stop:445 length:162 start_codon:yes stop_codon:yes gene_type:complete